MGNHSDKDLQQYIANSSSLQEKLDQLVSQLFSELQQQFQAQFGVPLPTADVAEVYQVSYDLQYTDEPNVDEYEEGAQKLIDGILQKKWPDVAHDALKVAKAVIKGVLGSGSVNLNGSASSTRTSEGGKDWISASLAVVSAASAKDWGTKKDFYVGYYALAVWKTDDKTAAQVRTTM